MTKSRSLDGHARNNEPDDLLRAIGAYYDLCTTVGIENEQTQLFKKQHASAQFDRAARQMEKLVREICPDGLGR